VVPGLPSGRTLPGLEKLSWIGGVPLVGAAMAWWYLRQERRREVVMAVCLTAVLFTGSLAAWVPAAVDPHKAPRALARILPADQLFREVRIVSLDYCQPSLNFYCRREVTPLADREHALQLLESPLEIYLLLRDEAWQQLRASAPAT